MDWYDDQFDGEEGCLAIDKAFIPLAEAPSALTVRQQKQKGSVVAESEREAERELALEAYPPLFAGEPEAARLARSDAFAACWEDQDANIQATLDGTDAGVFQQLLTFAQHAHRRRGTAAFCATPGEAGRRRVPTGLILAGGVNSADHCHTFPSLVDFLALHGCYVALLRPASFGKVPGDAINDILRQLSGLTSTKAEHMAALAQWYADQIGAGGGDVPSTRIPAQSAAGAATDEVSDDDTEEAEEEGQAAGERRTLRRRAGPGGSAPAGAASERQAANRERPLVVVVEGTEGVDVQCLRDFIQVASESHGEVPMTLLLGLTTHGEALSAMVPSDITDRCLELSQFKLAPAMERLDGLVQQVLLGGSGRWPGLLYSRAIIHRLHDAFLHHYYSTGIIRQGLRTAALFHFVSEPTCALATAAVEGREALEAACAALHPKVLAEVRRVLGCRSAAQVAACVCEAMAGWSRWAVGLQWLVAAAEAVGLRSQEFRPWKLLEEALLPSFAAGQLKQLLKRLQPLLHRLPPPAAAALTQRLQQRAAAVWGGAAAVEAELAELAGLEAGQQAGGEDEAGHREQGAAAAGEDAQRPQQEIQQQEEQQQEEQAGQKKKPKREVYHTKEARKEALLKKAKEQSAKSGAAAAVAAQHVREEAAAPGPRLAAWLGQALPELLRTLPTKLPGAAVFTCRDVTALDGLTAEPRAALHLALTEPDKYLPGLPSELGVSSALEDAVLAYRLLDQDPRCCNLADWYEAFAAVHTQGAVDQAAGGSGGNRKKAAIKKGKRKAAEGEEGDGAAGAAGDADVALRREIAARFSQATAELQYVGLIKPAKKRRGDYIQRVVHMPAAAL